MSPSSLKSSAVSVSLALLAFYLLWSGSGRRTPAAVVADAPRQAPQTAAHADELKWGGAILNQRNRANSNNTGSQPLDDEADAAAAVAAALLAQVEHERDAALITVRDLEKSLAVVHAEGLGRQPIQNPKFQTTVAAAGDALYVSREGRCNKRSVPKIKVGNALSFDECTAACNAAAVDGCVGINYDQKRLGCTLMIEACTGVGDVQRRGTVVFYARVLALDSIGVSAADVELFEQEQTKARVKKLRHQLEAMQRDRNVSETASRWKADATLTRAVFVQLGQDRYVHFLVQLKWFLLSWVYMRKTEPPHLKTDIVVFTQIVDEEYPGALKELEAFGCTTTQRVSFNDPSTCRIRDYVPLKFRNPQMDPVARDLKGYHYGESTQIVAEYPDDAYQYDIILRSDLDAFLTPGWAAWVPERRHTMYVGKGGFIQGDEKHGLQTIKRLRHAASRLGLPEPKVTNPGTSWVGDGRLMIVAARLQSEVIRWLHRYEFVDFDRCCAGMTGWPNWHYKVLTLYAGYIAFNTLGDGLKRIVMQVHEGTAGKGEWRGDNMMIEPIRHAHVLHGRGIFSKHDLADGKYDATHVKDLDPRLLPEFCLMTVVQSIRMPSTVLKELVSIPKLLDTSRPDIYTLDTRGGAQRHFGTNDGPPVDDDYKLKQEELPPRYNRDIINSSACWDAYWGRWMATVPAMPYTADANNECKLSNT